MVKRITYIDFISDHAFLDKYNNYQQRYAETIRESDRIILSIIDASLRGLRQSDTSCLDIGCSTGNLLLHIKNAFPSLKLMGGDLAQSSIDLCHANAALSSIRFATLNILNLPREEKFDIVVVNAVLYMLSDE